MSELRWHPILREWVMTATHRQDRTFLPPADHCPLCPTKPGGLPTEVPEPTYEIVAFDNRFPSLQPRPPEPAVAGTALCPVQKAQGVCEVILYTPQHEGTLTDRSVDDIEKLVYVWTDRFDQLSSLDYVKYVFIFENKGKVIGVTLEHPHGQIYAYPFIPPRLERELESARLHFEAKRSCLFCDLMREELDDGRRIVYANEAFLAVVPFYARFPYEVHITSRRHMGALTDMTPAEKRSLAEALKVVLLKYDNLWGFSMPYMMVMHPRPSDGGNYEYFHFHIEFYPPHRTPEKLKYLAGSEAGAGAFINDTLAEEKAAELREAFPQTTKDGLLKAQIE
ncbi:MAG: galactose-1-phosphate uridylyltransferase [Armatimonadota bacterium]